jgi:hypothetical protein
VESRWKLVLRLLAVKGTPCISDQFVAVVVYWDNDAPAKESWPTVIADSEEPGRRRSDAARLQIRMARINAL